MVATQEVEHRLIEYLRRVLVGWLGFVEVSVEVALFDRVNCLDPPELNLLVVSPVILRYETLAVVELQLSLLKIAILHHQIYQFEH